MKRQLTKITKLSIIDQRLNGNLDHITDLSFDEKTFGKGGFGTVHHVTSVNDKLIKSRFVVKIMTAVAAAHKAQAYETISLFHEKVRTRQFRTGLPIYHDFPELLGIPFAVFEAFDPLEQTECIGMLMFNLESLGYEDMGAKANTLQLPASFDIIDRLNIAHQLVRTIAFLHSIFYINSDLSIQSIFIHPTTRRLALIDYDGGYFFDQQNNPLTQGKLSYWASRLVNNVIGRVKSESEISTIDRLQNEYYAITVATFEILFSRIPYFFLKDNDEESKLLYQKNNTWPKIDFSADYANQATKPHHAYLIQQLAEYQDMGLSQITDSFRKVFGKGYVKGDHRATADEWAALLFRILDKEGETLPEITSFTSSREEITKPNQEVTLFWNVHNSDHVKLNGQPVDLFSQSVTLLVSEMTKYKLEVVNEFGHNSSELIVEAVKVQPRIHQFTPSHFVRREDEPISVRWETSDADYVEITSHPDLLPTHGTLNLEPIAPTVYLLTAVGYFGQRVTASIELSVVVPRIRNFTYRVDLNGGLDNVELNYDVEEAIHVDIIPDIGEFKTDSSRWVKLNGTTEFTLIARSHFAEATARLTAAPFPIPIIRQIAMDIPPIELVTDFSPAPLTAPVSLVTVPDVDLKFAGFENLPFVKFDMTQLQPKLISEAPSPKLKQFPTLSSNNTLFETLLKRLKAT